MKTYVPVGTGCRGQLSDLKPMAEGRAVELAGFPGDRFPAQREK